MTSAPDYQLDAKAWRTIGVVILAPFMTQMDSTIVNVSLTAIRDDLHSSISAAQWIISGYLLALALVLPLNGWLVDRFGAKKLYLFCFAAFTLASLACGAARTMPELITARVFQGVAGGLLVPLTQFMLARIAGPQMARVAGYATAPVLLAPLVGPPLAGAILKYASWPWLFYVNLPIGIIATVLAAIILPKDDFLGHHRPFDLVGFLLLSPGLSCFLYGFEEFSHHGGATFTLIGLSLLGAFLWWALRNTDRGLIDIDLFRISGFRAAVTTQLLANGVIYAGQVLIPIYLISGVGLSAAQAGWTLAAMGFGMLCVYPFSGYLTDRFGCRRVASTGVLINFLGTLSFPWMIYAGFLMPVALFSLFVRGVGQGATGIPSLAAAYAAVPKPKLGFAATSVNIVQRLGGPISTTLLAVVMSITDRSHEAADAHRFYLPFLALIFLQLLIFGSAQRLPLRIEDR